MHAFMSVWRSPSLVSRATGSAVKAPISRCRWCRVMLLNIPFLAFLWACDVLRVLLGVIVSSSPGYTLPALCWLLPSAFNLQISNHRFNISHPDYSNSRLPQAAYSGFKNAAAKLLQFCVISYTLVADFGSLCQNYTHKPSKMQHLVINVSLHSQNETITI